MGYIDFDPDEYETVYSHTPCSSCDDDPAKCNGRCSGSSSWGQKRRSPEAIAEIKRKKRLEREDRILAEAAIIKAERALRK